MDPILLLITIAVCAVPLAGALRRRHNVSTPAEPTVAELLASPAQQKKHQRFGQLHNFTCGPVNEALAHRVARDAAGKPGRTPLSDLVLAMPADNSELERDRWHLRSIEIRKALQEASLQELNDNIELVHRALDVMAHRDRGFLLGTRLSRWSLPQQACCRKQVAPSEIREEFWMRVITSLADRPRVA